MEELEADISETKKKIDKTENEIEKTENEMETVNSQLKSATSETDKAYFREEKKQLRKKEEDLREEKKQLREEKKQLQEDLRKLKDGGPSKKQKLDVKDPDVECLRRAFEAGIVENRFLKLDQSVSIRGLFLPSEIYVRQAYEEIHDKIHTSDRKNFLVTGNPGVGKTYFSFYELHCLLQQLKREKKGAVIYQSALLGVRYTFTPESCSAKIDDDECLDLIRDPSTYYLFDAGTKSVTKPELASRIKKTIVFSSPNGANYHDWAKNCEGGRVEFIMPAWEYEELELLPKLTGLRPPLSERFEWFGGIPRYLETEDSPDILQRAIYSCDVEKLLKAVASGDAADIAYKLLHMVPNDDYKQYSVGFASKYVTKLFYEKLERGARNIWA